MPEDTSGKGTEILSNVSASRRQVVKTAGQVAVTAPAVALLLNATTKSAMAQISPYQASSLHILDDFTFGNNEEDIDALGTGQNFNPNNGQLNLDDHV
jgi:hypothetical protein